MRCLRSVVAGSRKAPLVGIEDASGCVTMDTAVGSQLITSTIAYLKEVDSHDTPVVGGSSSLHREESAQIKEELNLISAGMLPLCYKDLVSASIHLAPPRSPEHVMLPSEEAPRTSAS